MMCRKIWSRVKPSEWPASIWLRGTASMPDAQDLGRIAREIEAHPEQRRGDRLEADADRRQREVDDEELHQERRVADELDVRRDRRAHPARPGRAQHRRSSTASASPSTNAPSDSRSVSHAPSMQARQVVPDDAELEDVLHRARPPSERAPRARCSHQRRCVTAPADRPAALRCTSCRSSRARRSACSGTPTCAGTAAGRNRRGARPAP